MQLLQSSRRSRRRISTADLPRSAPIEPSTQAEPSRHDEQMLTTRTVPADPFAVWLEGREEARRSANPSRSDRHVGVWL